MAETAARMRTRVGDYWMNEGFFTRKQLPHVGVLDFGVFGV
jgi:hypothetical protein